MRRKMRTVFLSAIRRLYDGLIRITYNKHARYVFSVISRCFNVATAPISNNLALLFMYLGLTVSISFVCKFKNYNYSFGDSLLYSFCEVFCLSIIALVLKKIRLGWTIIILSALFLGGEIFTILFYGTRYDFHVIQLIAETNGQETKEFLHIALRSGAFTTTVGLIFAILSLSILSANIIKKYDKRGWLVTLIAILTVWSFIRATPSHLLFFERISSRDMLYCATWKNMQHEEQTSLIRAENGISFNIVATGELTKLEESVKAIDIDSCSHKCPLIVLIIGESYNKHHSQLYEPNYLKTCPRLEAQRDKGNLIVYDDAVTSYNVTSHAFKYMFSTWDEDYADDWTSHTLFPALFKKAGYDTYFISNQFVLSATDEWDIMGGTFFNSFGLSNLQFTQRNSTRYEYDGDLIQEIPDIDSLASKPTLLICHLIGQHFEYNRRFPAAFAKFKPSDETSMYDDDEYTKEIRADYDNALYYNDYVVDSIFNCFKDKDAVCIYIADHGEEAFDWRYRFRRSEEDDLPPNAVRYQFEIPLMFYLSDTFKNSHPDVTERITSNTARRFITTNLCHLLFYLGGVYSKEYKDSLNILSDNYDNQHKRTIRFTYDYDEIIKQSTIPKVSK